MQDAPRSSTRLLAGVVWLYLASLVIVVMLLHRWADVWWPATLILFGPRWLWALPLAVLTPAALLFRRRLLLPLGLAALTVVGPIMGFEVPALGALASSPAHSDLRVMTYNIGGAVIHPVALARLLEEIAPDIAVFQECSESFSPQRLIGEGWHVEVVWGGCLASRYPIRKVDIRDPKDVWEMNGSGVIIRYEIEAPGQVVNVVDVHLETVREGLEEVMHRAWKGAPALEANIRQREFESSLALGWTARAQGPLLVMGDFNMPVESAIYRRFWSSFTNAFSACGSGFGVTKATHWHGIRIDHILLGPGIQCQRAWVGRDLGGDHRPMVAEVSLPAQTP